MSHALSNLEKRLRNFDRAREVLVNVVRRQPTAALCISLAELERQLGNPERARGVLEEGLQSIAEGTASGSERAKLLLSLAWLEEDGFGNTQEAFAAVEEAFLLDPMNVKVHIAKANLLLRLSRTEEARTTLQQCALSCGSSAEDGQHYTMWGSLELESGRPEEARRVLKEGAAKHPGDHFLLQRWGSLEAKLGRDDDARALFQRSAHIQPHAPTYVAWAILEEKQGTQAFEALQPEKGVLPDWQEKNDFLTENDLVTRCLLLLLCTCSNCIHRPTQVPGTHTQWLWRSWTGKASSERLPHSRTWLRRVQESCSPPSLSSCASLPSARTPLSSQLLLTRVKGWCTPLPRQCRGGTVLAPL